MLLFVISDGALDRRERVHVLDFGFRTELGLTRWPDADVGVDAQASLLHAHVAHIEVLQDLLESPEIRARIGGRADVGLAHYLDQRNTGPIEVDGGGARIAVVNRLARVFLHMQARDSDFDVGPLFCPPDQNRSAARQRLIELRDLVSLG